MLSYQRSIKKREITKSVIGIIICLKSNLKFISGTRKGGNQNKGKKDFNHGGGGKGGNHKPHQQRPNQGYNRR